MHAAASGGPRRSASAGPRRDRATRAWCVGRGRFGADLDLSGHRHCSFLAGIGRSSIGSSHVSHWFLRNLDCSNARSYPSAWTRPSGRSMSESRAAAITSGVGWAAGDPEVDREELLERLGEVLGGAEEVAAECAVAERGDAARLGHRVVGDQERLAHPGRDRAGDEEHVGVARRGDDAEAEALEVVVRARRERELVLAAVAGAGVDVADREAAAAVGAGERRSRGGAGGGRGRGSASAVRAGVAELEALVDQREVGQEVAGGGVGDGRPVGVGAGAEPSRARSGRRCRSTMQLVAPRGLSTRPMPISRSVVAGGRGGRSRTGRSSRLLEQRERLPSSSALLEAGADVAVGPFGERGLEALVGESGRVGRTSSRETGSRARPGRRCRAGARPSSVTTPTSGEAVLEGDVDEQAPPAALGRARGSRSSSSRAARSCDVRRARGRCRRPGRAEEEAVAGELRR